MALNNSIETASHSCNEGFIVTAVKTVHCPTCGSLANRRFLQADRTSIGENIIQTDCPTCDYLMVIGELTGRVIEAYSPGQSERWLTGLFPVAA